MSGPPPATGLRSPGPGRKHLDVVGAATREAVERANGAKLSVRQHRTFLAVLALTAAYTKTEDLVYLSDVARLAWSTQWAEDWQVRKTGEDLRALELAGVIERDVPRGRPSQSAPKRYRIGLPWPFVWVETHPEPGDTYTLAKHPDPGVSSHGKSPQDRSETHPDPGRKVTPGSGTPPRSTPRSTPSRRPEGPVLNGAARDHFQVEQVEGALDHAASLAKIQELRKVTDRQKSKGAA